MRCKITGLPLPAIWKHPDIDGQFVAALTRTAAEYLYRAVTGKVVDQTKFSRTGDFAWRPVIISTPEMYAEVLVKPEDIKE